MEASLRQVDRFLAESLHELRERRDGAGVGAHKRSLDILLFHAEFLRLLVAAYAAKSSGDPRAAMAALDDAVDYLRQAEPRYQEVFDTYLVLDRVIEPIRLGLMAA